MEMEISFPSNKRVDAHWKGFTIKTDQSEKNGGDGSAPAPFDLFLSSIGTCAGIYVLEFCKERDISIENANLILSIERNPETKMIGNIRIDVNLPADFPKKYISAVKRAADLCAVKKHILNPPEFDIRINMGGKKEME